MREENHQASYGGGEKPIRSKETEYDKPTAMRDDREAKKALSGLLTSQQGNT